jgi:hypothetical protein
MMPQTTRSRGLSAFFGLTCLIMLFTRGVMAILRIPGTSTNQSGPIQLSGLLLLFLGGLSPSIAGIVLTWQMDGRTGLLNLLRQTI